MARLFALGGWRWEPGQGVAAPPGAQSAEQVTADPGLHEEKVIVATSNASWPADYSNWKCW